MRYSQQRETIKDIISNTNSHPTADWIFDRVKEAIPNISLGTVYRNLKQLEEDGTIRTIADGSKARYDWNTEPHQHLRCTVCGELSDIHIADSDIKTMVKENYQFDVNQIDMVLFGTCQKHS